MLRYFGWILLLLFHATHCVITSFFMTYLYRLIINDFTLPPISFTFHFSLFSPYHSHITPTGQDWDADLEEFSYYNLTTDSTRTLGLTDEEFIAALRVKKSFAKILSSSSDTLSTETNGTKSALFCFFLQF